jgi:hypothetical protein
MRISLDEDKGRVADMLYPLRLALIVAILLGACVERRLLVRTDPPGAEVTVNGDRVGRSPARVPFTHYGQMLVEVEKPGYEPAEKVVDLRSPWYQKPGIDFFSDVLWPGRIEDEHEIELKLEPLRRLSPAEVERGVAEMTRAADSLRGKSEASR